jgi:alcohol dehydrogenase (cytochrome c)
MRSIGVRIVWGLLLAAGAAWTVTAQQRDAAGVSGADLLAGLSEPSQWLTYHGDYSGRRHSPLAQITPDNVHQLTAQWTFQTDTPGKFEATPILHDGILYVTGPSADTGWAIDARTGRQLWRHRRNVPGDVIVCCGLVNTGFGILGERLFKGVLDARVVSLDARTGRVLWETVMEDYKNGYSVTRAPLVVKDKVIIGMAGAEYGVRGFVDAYDAATGKRAWRFYTTAGPGDPGHKTWAGTDPNAWQYGGGSTWGTGTYDPEQNLVFWGTGNAGPDYDGRNREGDNLYTASLVALDADTGTLRWHYQYTPHDTFDYDAVQVPVLADVTIDGQPRKTVLVANRNGFFYTLDRTTGKVIVARPIVHTTWAKEIDANGRPVRLPGMDPSEEGTRICPAQIGGPNWESPSYDPSLELFFVTVREGCARFFRWAVPYKPGESFRGGVPQRIQDDEVAPYMALRAIDPKTATTRWEYRFTAQSGAGVLTTASNLLFTGSSSSFMALDSRTGKPLWNYQTGGNIGAAPITYMLDGRQYVLIPSGTTLTAFALPAWANAG